ncbi:MAG: transglutaminase domain-containing protein [bacterium]|nr:transglutaminase domain-containing protein [bacterium]
MKQQVRESLSYPTLRRLAVQITATSQAPNLIEQVRAIDSWVRLRVTIYSEYQEVLIAPLQMIREIEETGRTVGDCDDTAMLTAALLASVGFRVRFKAVHPMPDGSYGHVFTEYFIGPGWRPIDVTIRGFPVYNDDWLTLEV